MAKVNMNPGASYTAVITASQYDVGRVLTMEMYEGNSPKTFESGTTVKMVGTKPSGLGFTLDGSISGSTVTVITTATMTDESGSIPAELRFKLNGTDIGSANVTFSVEASPHPEGTTDGDAETARDLMTRATEAMLGAEAAADEAEASAQSAAASAEAAAQAGLDTTGSENGQVPTADGQGGWSWQNQQGGGASTSDDVTNESTVTGSTVTDALETLSGEIATKGTYSKPSGGIPKSDLASAVQTSLEKADTALQTAPVTSVAGKTGAVTLNSDNITNNSGVAGTTVSDAIDELDGGKENTTTIVTKTASDTSQTLAVNTFYVWPTMTALTITCPTTGGPYAFRFTSGSTATTLTMSGITMPDDFAVEANKVYEINVYQGFGLAASWAVS